MQNGHVLQDRSTIVGDDNLAISSLNLLDVVSSNSTISRHK